MAPAKRTALPATIHPVVNHGSTKRETDTKTMHSIEALILVTLSVLTGGLKRALLVKTSDRLFSRPSKLTFRTYLDFNSCRATKTEP